MQNQYNNSTANLRESVFAEGTSNIVHELFLEHVGKTLSGSRILDIGTGNGYILREIKKSFPGKYLLYGTDSSSEMIKKAQESNTKGIDFSIADNNNLPFSEGYFSTITAKNVTRFSPGELSRVLAEDGLLVFREYCSGKGLVEVADCFRERLIRSREPEFYLEQLSDAGFSNIQIQKFSYKQKYGKEKLQQIVQMFPFIENLNDYDLKIIQQLFGDKDIIEITSDPFILTARRNKNE